MSRNETTKLATAVFVGGLGALVAFMFIVGALLIALIELPEILRDLRDATELFRVVWDYWLG